MAQLLLAAIAADRLRRMTLEHFVRASRIEPFAVTPTGRIDADRELAVSRELRESPRDRRGIRRLLPEIINQHGHRLVREDLAEHLRSAHGRSGIADQRVRHRAGTPVLPEEGSGGVGGAADKADGTRLALCMR